MKSDHVHMVRLNETLYTAHADGDAQSITVQQLRDFFSQRCRNANHTAVKLLRLFDTNFTVVEVNKFTGNSAGFGFNPRNSNEVQIVAKPEFHDGTDETLVREWTEDLNAIVQAQQTASALPMKVVFENRLYPCDVVYDDQTDVVFVCFCSDSADMTALTRNRQAFSDKVRDITTTVHEITGSYSLRAAGITDNTLETAASEETLRANENAFKNVVTLIPLSGHNARINELSRIAAGIIAGGDAPGADDNNADDDAAEQDQQDDGETQDEPDIVQDEPDNEDNDNEDNDNEDNDNEDNDNEDNAGNDDAEEAEEADEEAIETDEDVEQAAQQNVADRTTVCGMRLTENATNQIPAMMTPMPIDELAARFASMDNAVRQAVQAELPQGDVRYIRLSPALAADATHNRMNYWYVVKADGTLVWEQVNRNLSGVLKQTTGNTSIGAGLVANITQRAQTAGWRGYLYNFTHNVIRSTRFAVVGTAGGEVTLQNGETRTVAPVPARPENQTASRQT